MFTRDRVSNLSIFEKHVQKLLGILNSPRHEQQPVNALDLCLRLTMDTASDLLLGQLSTACQTRLTSSLRRLPMCSDYKAGLPWLDRYKPSCPRPNTMKD
ncbi:hypothetical protein BDW66DRAFT_139867 [Aspergillus desertorum]